MKTFEDNVLYEDVSIGQIDIRIELIQIKHEIHIAQSSMSF
jgi:hypothetical protein